MVNHRNASRSESSIEMPWGQGGMLIVVSREAERSRLLADTAPGGRGRSLRPAREPSVLTPGARGEQPRRSTLVRAVAGPHRQMAHRGTGLAHSGNGLPEEMGRGTVAPTETSGSFRRRVAALAHPVYPGRWGADQAFAVDRTDSCSAVAVWNSLIRQGRFGGREPDPEAAHESGAQFEGRSKHGPAASRCDKLAASATQGRALAGFRSCPTPRLSSGAN